MEIKIFNRNPMGGNCYAVLKNGEVFLVDPGFYTHDLEVFLTENGSKVRYILLTHGHFDHFLGLTKVQPLCPNAKVVVHAADEIALTDPMVSLAAVFHRPQQNVAANILLQSEEQKLPFAGDEIAFLHTPGHSPGCVCYFFEDVIFSGDTLFYRAFGRTDHVGGNFEVLRNSVNRLLALPQNYKVYPGHGETTTLFDEKNNNPLIVL